MPVETVPKETIFHTYDKFMQEDNYHTSDINDLFKAFIEKK